MSRIFILPLLLFSQLAFSQIQLEIQLHADSILVPFYNPNKPGVGGALIHNGEVIYCKAQGLAHIDTKESIDNQTKFQIDALAKQFTSLGFLLLEENGKISLSESIRKYLPNLPAGMNEITLGDVLNHRTGLSDYNIVLECMNGYGPMIKTQESVLATIGRQQIEGKQGNFFLPESDTESILMAEIIEHASGKSFEEFMLESVFKKLGLQNTVVRRDPQSIIPGLAKSFQESEDEYQERRTYENVVGPTNVYSSIEDMARWYSFFSPEYTGVLSDLIKKLDTPVRNIKGETNHTGWGEMTYGREFLHAERGILKYWQYGLSGAYGANVFRFPSKDLTTIVIGNNNQYNGGLAMYLSDPIMEEHYLTGRSIDITQIKTVDLSAKQLKSFEGRYYNHEAGIERTMRVEGDTLRYYRGERRTNLAALSSNKFQALVQSDDVILFSFFPDAEIPYYTVSSGGSHPRRYDRYVQKEHSKLELSEYCGTYVNKEFGMMVEYFLEDDQLMISSLAHGKSALSAVIDDVFMTEIYSMQSVVFQRESNKISGFRVQSLGLRDINFEKMEAICDELKQ